MSESLYASVRERLARTGLPLIERDGWMELPGFGASGSWRLIAEVHEEMGAVVVYSVAHESVPPERREHVALLLHRLNFGLLIGNFELDLDTGELRFRTSAIAPGGRVDTAILDDIVGHNLTTMNHYLPAIRSVLDGSPNAVEESGP